MCGCSTRVAEGCAPGSGATSRPRPSSPEAGFDGARTPDPSCRRGSIPMPGATMSSDVDILGGYDPQLDFMLPERPADPKMRDSVSMWVSDDAGRFGFPRVAIEAIGAQWDERGVEANFA